MGVDIETATAVPAGIGDLSNSFTDGNAQGGTPPTQLNAKFFNALKDEINWLIDTLGGAYSVAVDPDTTDQLATVFLSALRFRRNHLSGSTDAFTLQTQADLTGTPLDWKVWEQTDHKAAAGAADHTLCAIEPPDNSQGTVTYRGTAVKVGALTTYHNVVVTASWRKSGGTVTVQSAQLDFQDGGGGATWTVVNSGGSVAMKVTVPGGLASANIFLHGHAVNVTNA